MPMICESLLLYEYMGYSFVNYCMYVSVGEYLNWLVHSQAFHHHVTSNSLPQHIYAPMNLVSIGLLIFTEAIWSLDMDLWSAWP